MAPEQMCTMILPASFFAVRPEEEVRCLNRCSCFLQYLYKDKFPCSGCLIKRLVDADFVNLDRWRQFRDAQQVMDELSQTGFIVQDEDQRIIIDMHNICTQELSFTVKPGEFANPPVCLDRHYSFRRQDILQAMRSVYSLLGAAGAGCLPCVMHLVHGCDVPFDCCSLNLKYTPLDWARWNRHSELVGYLERLMMWQENRDFVIVEGGAFASS